MAGQVLTAVTGEQAKEAPQQPLLRKSAPGHKLTEMRAQNVHISIHAMR